MAAALHQLLHACGLNEDDPGHGTLYAPPQGDLDIFATGQVVVPGNTPEADQLLVGGRAVPDAAGLFFLTVRTVGLVQRIWLLGRF